MSVQQSQKTNYVPSSTDPRCLMCKQMRCFQCEHKNEFVSTPRKTQYEKREIVKDHAKQTYSRPPPPQQEKKKSGCCC